MALVWWVWHRILQHLSWETPPALSSKQKHAIVTFEMFVLSMVCICENVCVSSQITKHPNSYKWHKSPSTLLGTPSHHVAAVQFIKLFKYRSRVSVHVHVHIKHNWETWSQLFWLWHRFWCQIGWFEYFRNCWSSEFLHSNVSRVYTKCCEKKEKWRFK